MLPQGNGLVKGKDDGVGGAGRILSDGVVTSVRESLTHGVLSFHKSDSCTRILRLNPSGIFLSANQSGITRFKEVGMVMYIYLQSQHSGN